MEREFLSLSSKNGAWSTVKEDGANNSKFPVRGTGMQWSFSNKVSALPQFLSFKTSPEDGQRNTVLDPLASSGYMTISNKNAFESNQKLFLGLNQKNFSIGNQAVNKHGMTVYPLQCPDAQSACVQESRIFSVSNQSNQMSPVLQSNLASSGLNMVNSAIKPQSLGSKSSGTPVSVLPSTGSIVGSTDMRNCSKSSGSPAQLTIFYAGSVCVYDDISLEKAQAIMLLAGNGSTPPNQNMSVSTAKLRPEISLSSKDDGFKISQSYPSPSPLPSPLPMISHASSQARGGSSSNNELTIIRPVGPSNAPTKHLESPIIVGSVGSAATKMVQPVGLPQARKASLARFLEKRKERVTTASPYYKCNTSTECSTPGSDSLSFSMEISGSCPQQATN